MGKGVEVHARGPRVIQRHQRPVGVCGLGEGGHVLHFHGDRSRTLAPYQPRALAQQILDPRSDFWRIETSFHSEPPQHMASQLPVGRVDTLRNQNMIAALQQRKINQRNRALPSGGDNRPITFFKLANLSRKFEGRGRTVQTVRVAHFVLIPTVIDRSGIGKQCSRSAKYRTGQRPVTLRYMHIGMNKTRPPTLRHAGIIRGAGAKFRRVRQGGFSSKLVIEPNLKCRLHCAVSFGRMLAVDGGLLYSGSR